MSAHERQDQPRTTVVVLTDDDRSLIDCAHQHRAPDHWHEAAIRMICERIRQAQ
ncbi:MAG: hypothetical protein ACP5QO_16645 [Clostridia bacterium]